VVLEVQNLSKQYGTGDTAVDVLRGVSFSLGAGQTLALEGESGSGKSTVLHLIAALDAPSGGSIRLDGREIVGLGDKETAALRRTVVGIIFQQFNLVPSLTIRANIAFHARLGGQYEATWADQLSERLGLSAHLDKYPEALSGGQQQRVAIARTLAARPKLILADEPTGNLDEDTADRVLDLMLSSAIDAGAAVLMVTHSPRQASRMARRLVLSHGSVTEKPVSAAAQ
jgi:putative ABC transport system ATP-binding protein